MDTFLSKHLRGVSRTYAIVVPMLPAPLGNAVGLAYLLMRIVDTVEDDPRLSREQRLRYFRLLDAALDREGAASALASQPLGETAAERALMRDAAQVIGRVRALEPVDREAICTCARAMSAGVRRLLRRSAKRHLPYPAVRSTAELREYCYYVAGVVGEMLCVMMAHFLRWRMLLRQRDLAVELGIGLQLVNILKDALKDSGQGRRYLPTAGRHGGAADHVYRQALAEARRCLHRGVKFVLALPAAASGLRMFCGLPIAWGALTLARAERDAGRAKISRAAIRSSIARFAALARNDEALREWLTTLLEARPGPDNPRTVVLPAGV